MSSPMISVVMPTFNGEKFIKEAIESILNQTFNDFEFIIVNDGSIDNTEKIIQSFSDKRIVYVKKEQNSGISDTLNLGISLAKGKYIARMDDDDISIPNRFERQLEVFASDLKIIVCGSLSYIKNSTRVSSLPEHHDDIKLNLLFNNCMLHPSVMILKEVLLETKYDLNFVPSEDYELWCRLIWKGEFYNIQEPLMIYRDHEGSQTSKRRKEQLLKNVDIGLFMYDKLELFSSKESAEYIRAFCAHDYSISGYSLKKLLLWFDDVKLINVEKNIFDNKKFNMILNNVLKRFVVSYFINRKLKNKLIPFFLMNFKYKRILINHYINK